MLLEVLLIIPLVIAVLSYSIKNRALVQWMMVAGGASSFVIAVLLGLEVWSDGPYEHSIWYVDQLSVYMLCIITFVALMVATYSVSYIRHDHEEKEIGTRQLKMYHIFVQIFLFTMLVVVSSNNMGIMWIAIEGTTLASAFLVGFYEKDTSIEAAWKYIIICSVGITLALFGTIITYASSTEVLGESSDALNWTKLRDAAPLLEPTFLKIAFIFIVIGYGTKVGLVPMHTWLPDAHSQAPSPVSALMSGVLLNCAFYGIIRYYIISEIRVPGFAPDLMLIFGLLSLFVAAFFILISRDFKRMLAYSSVEHMGIISLGFGIGGPLGIFGAMFHMLNHSLTKTLMFLCTGNVVQKYNTREIGEVRGMATVMPITAALFLLGALAITGSPPFGPFLSEIVIMQAGLSYGRYIVTTVYVLLLVVVFAGFMYHVSRMVFGEPTEGVTRGEIHKLSLVPMTILLSTILVIGIFMPEELTNILREVAKVVPGSG
ncbi:MAG: hydrogenase 4 subunit F [Methanomassiliicoccales archaeon]|nr:MAG: hydrogenase 4 subunit F [Methanomassiliicoccales archaeon]